MTKSRLINIIFAILLFATVFIPLLLVATGKIDPSTQAYKLTVTLGTLFVAPIASVRLLLQK